LLVADIIAIAVYSVLYGFKGRSYWQILFFLWHWKILFVLWLK